uniref:RING-type domain-containing protein n=1 Tax=Stegastes partitus TaxID=144197 RepID=A0A3B5B9G3_9TELE
REALSSRLLCSVCLDVFTDPVTVPCGHNFCMKCITQTWDSSAGVRCPMCRRDFDQRPELSVNTGISKVADQLKKFTIKEISFCSTEQQDEAGDVLCDACPENKLTAVKSCLVCLTSYCETHLKPHHSFPGLKRHQLMDPVMNLEDRLRKKHDRPLELIFVNVGWTHFFKCCL